VQSALIWMWVLKEEENKELSKKRAKNMVAERLLQVNLLMYCPSCVFFDPLCLVLGLRFSVNLGGCICVGYSVIESVLSVVEI
jgi:hypothetical protein